MDTTRSLSKVIAGALLSGGLAVAGLGLTAATAQAQPPVVPPMHGLFPEDGPVPPGASGPYTWCPGDRIGVLHPDTGRGGPPPDTNWDMSRCHTWYGVRYGLGNVGPSVWEGTTPPPPEATQPGPCGFPFMCSGTPS
jgi:hypothetical protein